MAQNALKPWEQLTITDNYLFQLVMRRKHLCKQLIEKILQIKIRDIAYPEYEKTLIADPLKKSIRLDVYVEDDEGRVYDIEMQCTNPGEEELGTRARYYQSVIDNELLDKGASYRELNTSFIIFLCTFDPFNRGRALYTFHTTCKEEQDTLKLKDKEYKIFLNSTGWKMASDPDLRAFLRYVDGKAAEGEFTEQIDEAVRNLRKSPMERRTYMLLSQLLTQEIKDKIEEASYAKGVECGKEEGRQEGKQEGKAEEKQQTAAKLLQLGVPLETIAAGTSLPLEEIQEMAKKK